MCCSKQNRAVSCAQANQSRCPSCYKAAPYHRRHCAVAAAAIASAQSNVQTMTDPIAPPPYTATPNAAPTVIAYQGRHVPHGPIGFAVRWGVEKMQQKRDEKKFMEEFEKRRSMERQSSSSSDSESGHELIDDGTWNGDKKRKDLI